ncbi:MAG: tetratricopeptide repeat protein [Candidatus Omnitrophica bacterium]|nr:tetratricopeptide repeat protein [Candidatus Omnitrophota bacterium]
MIRLHIAAFFLIALIGLTVYGAILGAPFQLDDNDFVLDNPVIKNLANVTDMWNYTPRKFLTFLTFACNYAFGKNDPFGYHLVNLFLHIMTAYFLYGILSVLSSLPAVQSKGRAPFVVALFGALIFLVHPIQTESVTYIWQRSTVLSAFFYLASFFMYVTGRASRRPWYYGIALVLFITGFFAKGDIVMLPCAIILCEILFFNVSWGSLRKILVKSWPILAVIALGALLNLAAINTGLKNEFFFSGTGDIPRGIYLLTQFRVVVRYLALVLVPLGQNVDHYVVLASHGFFEPRTLVSLALVTAAIIAAIFLFRRNYRVAAFGILLFFINLIPTSSIFPLSTVMFEHRLYLPMMGFSIFLSSLVMDAITSRIFRNIAMSVILAALCFLTMARNTLWCSPTRLLEDAVMKSPLNARPHLMLGAVYYKLGNTDRARQLFERAIALSPRYPDPYNNLGLIFMDRGDTAGAERAFRKALLLNESFSEPYINLAHLAVSMGDYDSAERLLKRSLRYRLSDKALTNLGTICFLTGRGKDAEMFFRSALRVNPESNTALYNLGNLYASENKYTDAVTMYETALRIKPDMVDAYSNLGIVAYRMNDLQRAADSLRKAVLLSPQRPDIYEKLATVYDALGNKEKAVRCRKRALAFMKH